MIRAMSQSSAFFGNARCAASRSWPGETTGSQSALSQRVRRPRWVSWIITAQSCSWHSSASAFIQPTTSSFQARRLLKTGGLSRATEAEPAVIVIAMPARARSTW